MTTPPTLDLNELVTGNIPAVTPVLGAFMAEAAGVCLESQGHSQGVTLEILGWREATFSLHWTSVSNQARDLSYNDQVLATEMGASGIAALLASDLTGYLVLEPSRGGTGFDYWLGEVSDGTLEYHAGLEVSGIRRGSAGVVAARMREKLQQAAKSNRQGFETFAIVVEFGRPLAEVQKNDL